MKYLRWNPNKYSDSCKLIDAYNDFRNYITAQKQEDIPLIVQIMENPRYDKYRFYRIKGSISLEDHDLLHIILKQKIDLKGEAYIIGYTMGSAKGNIILDLLIYQLVSVLLYPKNYRFKLNHIKIMNRGYYEGKKSKVDDLHKIPFKNMMNETLKELRDKFNINI